MRRGEVKIKKGPVAALLIILLVVVVTEVTPRIQKMLAARQTEQEKQSLAKTGADTEYRFGITVAGDPWSGYFVFRSEKFRSILNYEKIRYTYKTEEDLVKRFEKLASGEYDMVVATIDGYTLNGLKSEYPGVITWVIDESFGGDALVGGPKVQTIDDLDNLPDLARVSFAEGYPSEHLLSAVLTQFKKKVRSVPVKGSREALDALKGGKADAAVLWEPETTNAVKEVPGAKVLISTRDMVDFIVDVVIVSRKLVATKPEVVEEVLRAYYSTYKYYEKDPVRMTDAIAQDAGVPVDTARAIQQGIRFVNQTDNGFKWFGVGGPDATEKLSKIIQETVDIQVAQSRLSSNPLKDPLSIVNRAILEKASSQAQGPLAKKFSRPVAVPTPTPEKSVSYDPLSAQDWEKAERVGTLDVAPIYFSAGSTELAKEDKDWIDEVARKLVHYPRLRLRVVGHTSPGGDAKASRILSEERARVVGETLATRHSVPAGRFQIVGKGGGDPLPKKPGENSRSWQSRCQRVEFILVASPQ